MNIDNPKNELYNDFVQLVDRVSSSIVKESIVPISGQMQTASQAMQKISNEIDSKATNAIKQGVSPTLKQLELTSGIMKQASDNISNLQSNILSAGSKTDNALNILSSKIDNDVKERLVKNSILYLNNHNELKNDIKNLSEKINSFEYKQQRLIYYFIGLTTFFGLSVLGLLLFLIFGMK